MREPLDSLTLTVPIPPSANHLWQMQGGRVRKSKRYEAWQWECSLTLGRQRPVKTPCRVRITVKAGSGFPANRDLDNLFKPLLDLLRILQVIPDDNVTHVRAIEIVYRPSPKGESSSKAAVTMRVISLEQQPLTAGELEASTRDPQEDEGRSSTSEGGAVAALVPVIPPASPLPPCNPYKPITPSPSTTHN